VANAPNRDTIYNQTFGGSLINIGKTEAYKGSDVAAYLVDVVGMVTCKRVMCLICCDALCPLGYTNGEKTYEYGIKTSGCCCCKKYWMEASRGSSADVEQEKPGATVTPLGYTYRHEGCCYCGDETWAVGDMTQDPESKEYVKGPLKYGIRNKPDCCKVGCCACWGPEKEACSAIVDGNVVVNTYMPLYRNPNPAPTDPELAKDYGTKSDWENRTEVVGTVTYQNLLMPCCCYCAQPGACPLNVRVDLNQAYANQCDDDEKFKLGLFAHAAMGVVVPGQNMYPGILPLPMAWFTMKVLMIIGYMFGWGMANTEYEFKGLKQAFAGGLAETGDLIPKAIDAAKAGVASAKQAF